MKPSDYLKDKVLFLLFDLLLLASTALLFYLLGVGSMIVIFFEAIFIACLSVPLIMDFFRRRRFYNGFLSLLNTLEQKNLIAEIMEKPDFKEGMILYDSLRISNKAMLEAIKKYSKAQEEYREYIEMWVHEIKTPIASSRLILENHREIPAEKGLSEDLNILENLVEQVLFYARSNAVEKDYMVRKTDLKDVVYAVARRNAKLFIERRIRFEMDGLDLVVNTDAKWIEFILNQIVGNAVKYCDKENPEICIAAHQAPNAVILNITDNGIGIPEDEVDRVFEKGFTGTNGRQQEKSTGMGLYLCARLCEKLGHGFKIISEYGKGTTVVIVFPESSMHKMQ
ncbi:sensor histidine kinase [Christensenella tenuis]|uniref:histidine kinase n=1 Tax=Christensenella tenuis TaxID=2763033 RepID=A0ABR7EBY3_9FIRM|nr:sensor histidine kinase [Christensenella tenuis]MBC5647279.1 sensor histidine kinase [Christensenella tenuis]